MSEETFVTISDKEYGELLDAQFKLQCLESCGVNNWEGYEQALELMEEINSSNM